MFIFCPNRVIQRADFCKIWAGIEISLLIRKGRRGRKGIVKGKEGEEEIHIYTYIHTPNHYIQKSAISGLEYARRSLCFVSACSRSTQEWQQAQATYYTAP